MIVGVALDTPLRRTFDYRLPPLLDGVGPGHRVWVPFGRRRLVGIVVERREHSTVPAGKLREVLAAIDREPTFDPGLFELLQWAAQYYRHPLGEALATALPVPLREGVPLYEERRVWRLTEAGRTRALAELPARAARLRRVIEFLVERTEVSGAELAAASGATADSLRKLAARGYLEQQLRRSTAPETATGPDEGARSPGPAPNLPVLNEAQQAALERMKKVLGTYSAQLLYGVTGSGKTEVYLRLVAAVLERGRQALVLVPEIALTPQLIARFRDRFEVPLALLHSGLSEGERLAAWRSAREGAARIIIGTRSAVFAPLPQLGVIVVDEEHDPSFKQQDGFRYSARDLAIVRAQRLAIPIVLGSATPSLETLARARRDPDCVSRLMQRAAGAQPPRVSLVDLRRHGQTQGLATPTMMAMRRHLDAGGQIMLFLNRRGYAPVLFCPACGWAAHCRRCDAHLTVHGRGRLICHHCGARQDAQGSCGACGAPAKPVGQGTERIEETVQQLFPDALLARIDRDSMRRKGELEATLAKVRRNELRVLVGTQMLAKGHDFPNVTLVVVLNADQGLFSTDFRGSERLAQTIVQVTGRAGRAERPGEVLIQTEYPEHPLLRHLLSGGYEAFADAALTERERSGWPPYARIALLRAEAAAAGAPMRFLQAALLAGEHLGSSSVSLRGPAPASMERRAGRFRAQLLLQASAHAPLQRFLGAWLPHVERLPEAQRVRWSIDVDPQEL